MNHEEEAKRLFMQGYNCAQAVFCAFCDETGLDIDTAARMASSFGGGMGRLREVCGTVSGALLALGILRGYDDPADPCDAFRQIRFPVGEFFPPSALPGMEDDRPNCGCSRGKDE